MAPEKSCLSTEDACRIIETSAKTGVTELTFSGLHVKFGRLTENDVGLTSPFVQQAPRAPVSVNALTEEQHTKQATEALEMDELRLRQDQLAQALVEDPLKYEELLMQGELDDALDGADEDDDLE